MRTLEHFPPHLHRDMRRCHRKQVGIICAPFPSHVNETFMATAVRVIILYFLDEVVITVYCLSLTTSCTRFTRICWKNVWEENRFFFSLSSSCIYNKSSCFSVHKKKSFSSVFTNDISSQTFLHYPECLRIVYCDAAAL